MRLQDALLLGLLALLWGSSYLFVRVAVAEIPPVTLIAGRVAVAALLLTALMRGLGLTLPRGGRLWWRLLLQAMFNSILGWTILAWGQARVGAGLASVLNSTSPVFVVLALAAAGRQPGTAALAGSVVGLAGVALVVGPVGIDGRAQEIAGMLACLVSAMLYAGAALHGARVAAAGPVGAAAGTMLWATALLVPLALVVDRPWHLAPSATALAAAFMLSVFCTGLALIVYFRLIDRIGAAGTASQSYLRAGVGLALGIAVLGERPEPLAIAGLVLVILGVALLNRR